MIKQLEPFKELIKQAEDNFALDPALIGGIIMQESGGRICSYRAEPTSTLSYLPQSYANKLYISLQTEINFQRCSWGLMHIMGFKAREVGYDDHFFDLISDPQKAIYWGCKALVSFKSTTLNDMIASYNAGSPKQEDGVYSNQGYVDGVKMWMERYG